MADMGTLQRLPAIVGHGVATELALTARNFSGGLAGAGWGGADVQQIRTAQRHVAATIGSRLGSRRGTAAAMQGRQHTLPHFHASASQVQAPRQWSCAWWRCLFRTQTLLSLVPNLCMQAARPGSCA